MTMVTALYTQGRQGSDEYVREYFMEYSDDGGTWRVYTNQLGIPNVSLYNFLVRQVEEQKVYQGRALPLKSKPKSFVQ